MGIEAAFINGSANVEAAAELEEAHNDGAATPADIALQPLKQGGHVSCSMLATAAGMLGRDPSAISSMVKFLGSTVEPSKGKKLGEKYYRFEVNFFKDGKPQKSEVKLYEYDMLMAARGGGLAYAAIEDLFVLGQGDIRSFTADSGVGTTGTKAIEAMTGAKAKYLEVKKTPVADLTNAMTTATQEKRLVVAGTSDKAAKGITASHAFTVLACDGSTVSLFDPHAKDPEGADGVTAAGKSDGYFTMKMDAFLAAFHHVDIEQPKKTD